MNAVETSINIIEKSMITIEAIYEHQGKSIRTTGKIHEQHRTHDRHHGKMMKPWKNDLGTELQHSHQPHTWDFRFLYMNHEKPSLVGGNIETVELKCNK
jgi:hypothetical protein